MDQNNRPKYEKPSLITFDMSPIMGQQNCNPFGSVPQGKQCMDGGTATGKCQAGSVASGAQCHPGSVASAKCQSGSVAGGQCSDGSVGR